MIDKEEVSRYADGLLKLLKQRRDMSQEQSEAIAHALVDIAESIEKIYGSLIQSILDRRDSSDDDLNDALWELREEFRHIQYHVCDSKLTEL